MLVDIVSVGIDDYFEKNGKVIEDLRLEFASADAAKFFSMMRRYCDVRTGFLLSDAPSSQIRPTRNQIISCLASLLRGHQESDCVTVFFFAGHGISINGGLYLCPADYDKSISQHSAIPFSLVCEIVAERVGPKIFFLDCCRSPLDTTISKNRVKRPRVFLPVDEDMVVLLSCSSEQNSYERQSPPSGGLFTNFFIREFSSRMQKTQSQEFISVMEVFNFARDKTVEFVQATSVRPLQRPIAVGYDADNLYLRKKT